MWRAPYKERHLNSCASQLRKCASGPKCILHTHVYAYRCCCALLPLLVFFSLRSQAQYVAAQLRVGFFISVAPFFCWSNFPSEWIMFITVGFACAIRCARCAALLLRPLSNKITFFFPPTVPSVHRFLPLDQISGRESMRGRDSLGVVRQLHVSPSRIDVNGGKSRS